MFLCRLPLLRIKNSTNRPVFSFNTDFLQLVFNTESLLPPVAESNVAFEAQREQHSHPKASSMHPGGLIQLMGFYVSIVCGRIMLSDLPLVQSFAFEGLGDSEKTVLSRPLSPENMFSAVLQSSDACLLACCQLLTRDQPKSPHTASSVRLHSPVFKTTCPINSYLTRLSGREDLPKRRKFLRNILRGDYFKQDSQIYPLSV